MQYIFFFVFQASILRLLKLRTLPFVIHYCLTLLGREDSFYFLLFTVKYVKQSSSRTIPTQYNFEGFFFNCFINNKCQFTVAIKRFSYFHVVELRIYYVYYDESHYGNFIKFNLRELTFWYVCCNVWPDDGHDGLEIIIF